MASVNGSGDLSPARLRSQLAPVLLGSVINSFEAHSDGTLQLAFSRGSRLTFLDSSEEFESYDITRPGQTIIV